MYQVEWTNGGETTLKAVKSKAVQKKMLDKADGLKVSPLQSGKRLEDDLSGFRSIPAAGRYRLIYRVDSTPFTDPNPPHTAFEGRASICAAGIRKKGSKSDIYRIASAMRSRGEL